jgi:hypothetical protein
MIKSWCNDETKWEWDDIRKPAHVAKVHAAIDKNFTRYFDSMVKPAMPAGADLFAKLGEKFKVTGGPKPPPSGKADASAFVAAIGDYDKKAQRYRNLCDLAVLQEFRDDGPDAFKAELSRKCPVIVSVLQSKNAELKDWKIGYRLATSESLLSVFESLLRFGDEYMGKRGLEKTFSKLRTAKELALDHFDTPELSIPGVIGSGIKSLTLYHLHPSVFPSLGGRSMFALYFLTERSHFSLRSGGSEFLIINDGLKGKDLNMPMDHNYWYPYSPFAEYAMHVARLIESACAARGIDFDAQYRQVYVDAYFGHVCRLHAADLKVMAGIDDLREPSWAAK